MLISRQAQFNQFAAQLREATQKGSPLCFDTEFLSEKRYYARLCLVQVLATTETGVVEGAIDPFNLDLAPLLELIADENIVKIVHSGASDLRILWQNFGIDPRNVFDTQIAAAFLGFGHQISYADLVRKVTGTVLSKTMQYTDWSARPLSEEQIEYALADVRHLPPIYAHLKAELEKRGRLNWAQTEFQTAEDRAIRVETAENAYRRLNLSGLSRRQLAVLRETAAVRETIARDIDKPPSFIMPDLALLQLSRQQPKNVNDLRGIRGMPGIPEQHARKVLAAIDAALKSDPATWPETLSGERPDPRIDSIVSLLGVIVSARATSEDVSRNYLARRDEMFDLASWWLKHHGGQDLPRPEIELLKDWREELVGRDLIRLLNGELVIALDPMTGLPELKSLTPNDSPQ